MLNIMNSLYIKKYFIKISEKVLQVFNSSQFLGMFWKSAKICGDDLIIKHLVCSKEIQKNKHDINLCR